MTSCRTYVEVYAVVEFFKRNTTQQAEFDLRFLPEVLSLLCLDSIVQILNRWWVWSLTWSFLSVSITFISRNNQWLRRGFLLTNSCRWSVLRYMNRGGQPEAKTQVEGPQVKYICIKELKKSHLRNETQTATQCCWGGWGGVYTCSVLIKGCWPPILFLSATKAGTNHLNEKNSPTGIGERYSQTISVAPMWTPPISESDELTLWSLNINHYSEVLILTSSRETMQFYIIIV